MTLSQSHNNGFFSDFLQEQSTCLGGLLTAPCTNLSQGLAQGLALVASKYSTENYLGLLSQTKSIYMQWFSARGSLNIKIMVKKCQKYPILIFAVSCKSSRSQMFLRIVVKNFAKFTRKHPESLVKKM